LALLQEEAVEPTRRRDVRRLDGFSFTKPPTAKGPLPLPPPPARAGAQPVPDDKKPQDDRHLLPRSSSLEDKFQSLRSYRKAEGQCIRCGERWRPGHKCAPVMQLHALQEVWNLCQDEFDMSECSANEEVSSVTTEENAPAQLFLLMSASATSGNASVRSMQFTGSIEGHDILILVDSGSSHSFIDSSVAAQLLGVCAMPSTISVQVANGSSVPCSQEIPMAVWTVQGYEFHSNLKVLPLGSYDMILGMDWLEAFSPMKVHKTQKWISIPYGPTQVLLQGQLPDSDAGAVVQVFHIASDAAAPAQLAVHPSVQLLLDEFSAVFAEPQSLPPRRACDHTIPLIPGAQPVSVRPYRYAPALKTEIETQVTEMLQSGLIRPSTSAFSSPVLLVRKKDGKWRFCVDYRLLNALTIKSKFPIPVIDELLDELSHASWFSVLDLHAGFNQIRLAPGEEHKTAFQTHWGHFEFSVMSFGLTGAPNTIQGAMNTTLHPVDES